VGGLCWESLGGGSSCNNRRTYTVAASSDVYIDLSNALAGTLVKPLHPSRGIWLTEAS
jgi:hypothetical protein